MMTEIEAIKILDVAIVNNDSILVQEASKLAIKALEKQSMVNEILHELKEYSLIGTVEEFKTLKEKQIAKKPIEFHSLSQGTYVKCPTCNWKLYDSDWWESTKEKYHNNICLHCGQRLTEPGRYLGDWEEAEQALAEMQKG